MIVTDPASAETIKYAANAFLATKLSFVNAVAAICEGVGADVNDVVLGLGYDKRIGRTSSAPALDGAAVASPRTRGRCSRSPRRPGYAFDLLEGVIAVNDEQLDRVTRQDPRSRRRRVAGKDDRRVGPDVQGRHRRPARVAGADVVERLREQGAEVRRTIPRSPGPSPACRRGRVCDDPYAGGEGADVLAVLTEWDEFRFLDPGRCAATMAGAPSSTAATCSTGRSGPRRLRCTRASGGR